MKWIRRRRDVDQTRPFIQLVADKLEATFQGASVYHHHAVHVKVVTFKALLL